jgi:glycosyltransferase involved in cell wall biosynthesis
MGAQLLLEHITPVILTYNEEPNIGRMLERLRWAREIVVVDSHSTDKTVEIVRTFPQVRLFQRAFDSHSRQWNYAAFETGIESAWILALDADYVVTDEALQEIRRLDEGAAIDGYTAGFRYCVWGRPLRGTLYPPVTVLFRRTKGSFVQDGHTHRLQLDGNALALSAQFLHDDRKPLSHWLAAQDRYMRLEAEKISAMAWSELGFADRVRRVPLIAPFAVFISCYVLRLGFLDGSAGLYYALQRMLAEALLGLRLIEQGLSDGRGRQG